MNRHLILSEIVHSALIMAGYQGDAHHFVNHTLVPRSAESGDYLIDELLLMAIDNKELKRVVENIPQDLIILLRSPEDVIGKAQEKAIDVAKKADSLIAKYNYVLK